MLELKNVSKSYGSSLVVRDVSLTIQQGEFFCLLGPSGCGKTTILRMIAGFEKPTSGNIMLNGEDISSLPPNKRDVNTVFQNYALFPSLNIFENVAYGLRVKKVSPKEIEERVEHTMKIVGLQGFAARMPHQISGGQQQRVALARALINKPSILLLDEPLSALDKKIAEQTRIELLDIQRKIGITFIFVTHNQAEALTMADRIAVMKDGEMLQCDAPNKIYEKPKSHFVADFIGAMNFFNATIIDKTSHGCILELDGLGKIETEESGDCKKDDKVIFCLRPETIKLSLLEPKEYENGIKGKVEHRIFLGDVIKHVIRLSSQQQIVVNFPNYLPFISNEFYDINENVYLIWSKSAGIVLNEKTSA